MSKDEEIRRAADGIDRHMQSLRRAVRKCNGKVPPDVYERICSDCRDMATALREIKDALPAEVEFDEDAAKTELDIVRGWME